MGVYSLGLRWGVFDFLGYYKLLVSFYVGESVVFYVVVRSALYYLFCGVSCLLLLRYMLFFSFFWVLVLSWCVLLFVKFMVNRICGNFYVIILLFSFSRVSIFSFVCK